jgi:hypothetical protein
MKRLAFLAAVACLASAGPAAAGLMTFDLTWSGSALGNNATATGQITIDTSLLPNPSPGPVDISGDVTAFSITVSGSSSGNGTFGLADFAFTGVSGNITWNTNGGTLDLTKELIGQSTSNMPWGTTHDGTSGDFNIFNNGTDLAAPSGTDPFVLTTSGGDAMDLTSFAPATVPEPASLTLLGLGVASLAGYAWRRRR